MQRDSFGYSNATVVCAKRPGPAQPRRPKKCAIGQLSLRDMPPLHRRNRLRGASVTAVGECDAQPDGPPECPTLVIATSGAETIQNRQLTAPTRKAHGSNTQHHL